MRIVYPIVTGHGLGNNLVTVAKAYSIAKACKMTYQPPIWPRAIHVWPPTKKGYGYYWHSTLGDKIRLRLFSYLSKFQGKFNIQVGPRMVRFDRNDYEKTGIVDMGEACLEYLKQFGLEDPATSVVVTTKGMWGGYASIRRERDWLRQLLLSHPGSRRRLKEIEQGMEDHLRIAVNIRMGDFQPRQSAGPIREGERVVRLPLDYYARICRLIRQVCDCDFILVTDGTREELLAFLEEFAPISIIGQPYQDLLGVLLLSRSDLVICSNSTYSRLGVFLNDKPYIWFADTLVEDQSGRFGYLWKEGGTPMPAWFKSPVKSTDTSPDTIRRCFPLRGDSSALPEGLRRWLLSGGKLPIENWDDLLYGEPIAIL